MTTTALRIPTLTTQRLVLRAPTPSDLGAYSAFNAASEITVGTYKGGKTPAQTKAVLNRDIDHWSKGFGMWLITFPGGEIIGGAGLVHHSDWPSHELTWWLMPEHRGHGFATEASLSVIEFGYGILGWPVVETHMRDENTPARRLAERLGGTVIRRDIFPDGVARDVFALPRPNKAGAQCT